MYQATNNGHSTPTPVSSTDIRLKYLAFAFVIISAFSQTGCISLGGDITRQAPRIHAGMPLEDIIDASIEFGHQTVADAKKIIKKKKLRAAASTMVRLKIIDHFRDWKTSELINATNLYQITDSKKSEEIFKLLVTSDRKLARQISWIIARKFASPKMALAIDQIITNAIENDELEDILVEQLPAAIAANNMKSSYSILRYGLFRTNHDSYAKAMIAIGGSRASGDFLTYLAQAPLEELRQLTLNSLNVYTCVNILNHFLVNRPDIGHPQFKHLFLFALSRNMGLSELARKVILQYLPMESMEVARQLSRMSNWVQIAFITGSRRSMTPALGVMLAKLKSQSSEKTVIEEIDAVRL